MDPGEVSVELHAAYKVNNVFKNRFDIIIIILTTCSRVFYFYMSSNITYPIVYYQEVEGG